MQRAKKYSTFIINMFRNEEVVGIFLGTKQLVVEEELAYGKIINCTNAVELWNTGKYSAIFHANDGIKSEKVKVNLWL